MTRLAWPSLPLSEPLTNGIPLEHRTYLRDGEILVWEGPVEDVLSPVCVAGQGRASARCVSAAIRASTVRRR